MAPICECETRNAYSNNCGSNAGDESSSLYAGNFAHGWHGNAQYLIHFLPNLLAGVNHRSKPELGKQGIHSEDSASFIPPPISIIVDIVITINDSETLSFTRYENREDRTR